MNKEEIKKLAIRAGRGCGKDEDLFLLLLELAFPGISLPPDMVKNAIEQDKKFIKFMRWMNE